MEYKLTMNAPLPQQQVVLSVTKNKVQLIDLICEKLDDDRLKGALYRIYQVRILCRRFPAKCSAIVSPALVMHDSVDRRDRLWEWLIV